MKALLFTTLATLSGAAVAQTAPPAAPVAPAPAEVPFRVGATVLGKDYYPAGKIVSFTDQVVVIDTGTHQVPLPPTSVGRNPKGFWLGMTKAELEALYVQSVAQAKTAFDARLAPGTMVHGLNGAMLGTITARDADQVTINTPKGDVKVSVSGFAPGASGTVVVGVTQADLDAQLAAGRPAGG